MGSAAKFGRERPESALGPSDERYPGTGTGKAVGESLADSPRCPCDQYSFPLQLHFPRVRSACGLGSDSENLRAATGAT
jgi:hypothetical protein